MRLSSTRAGMRSCVEENDKAGNVKDGHSVELGRGS